MDRNSSICLDICCHPVRSTLGIERYPMSMTDYTREQQLIDIALANKGYISVECASGFIQQITYDMQTGTLVTTIRGTNYPKFNVPFEVFVKYVNSDSKGCFYNDHIKFKY
jgi:hypothetical protein